MHPLSSSKISNPLPASFLRGGTSKGIFINRKYLPPSQQDWSALFLRIMGSPDPEHGRQLNGMGGGVSSLSKIIVVGPPSMSRSGIDVEYTFAQVGIRDEEVDYSGNCGNLTSMVGVFAMDEGIYVPKIDSAGQIAAVHVWNTNTDKEIRTTFPVSPDKKPLLDLEEVSIAGVPGKASRILLDFVDPAGARTGSLLPTGNAMDSVVCQDSSQVMCSLVDATNPSIFVGCSSLFNTPHLPPQDAYISPTLLARLEDIRRAGAQAMGLDPAAQAQPKIAVVGHPADGADVDVDVQALSMGVLHRAVPMTVGLCLGVAALSQGTVVHAIVQQVRGRHGRAGREQGLIRLRHPSGIVDVGAEFRDDGSVSSAKVVRTGRKLMQGAVWW